jgi:plasmid replication initiation protein
MNEKILKPSVKELSSIFAALEIQKIKGKKGNKIEKLIFTFNKAKGLNGDNQFEDN